MVIEEYKSRTVNNHESGVMDLPNTWLHHNALAVYGKDYGDMTEEEKCLADGVLDYTRWSLPDYRDMYDGSGVDISGPLIVINNQYNIEKGREPTRYFDIECLYNMFNMLTEKGYTIVYNRPDNTEFVTDENEKRTLWAGLHIYADVEDHGQIDDYTLCNHFENVHKFKDLLKESSLSYNEYQLNLFAKADGFIGLVGGAGTLSCFYQKPTIMYATVSRAIRPSYWSEDSYYQVMSNQNAHPVIDTRDDQIARGGHDYSKLYELIEELF